MNFQKMSLGKVVCSSLSLYFSPVPSHAQAPTPNHSFCFPKLGCFLCQQEQ